MKIREKALSQISYSLSYSSYNLKVSTNEKQPVKRKLGHVVQNDVCRKQNGILTLSNDVFSLGHIARRKDTYV